MGILLVCVAAFVASALNAIAGGGTFLAFPALTGLGGLSEKAANVACTIGLWPGSASAVVAVRREFGRLPRFMVIGYTLAALAGGFLGAELLLHTREVTFHYAIPWLLAFATTVFAMGNRIAKFARREPAAEAAGGRSVVWSGFVGLVQFILSIYGGYFGAGMGVLTLAGLSLVGLGDIRQINVLKVLLSTATNLTAAIVFLFGPVEWQFVGPMAGCSIVGGFVGMNLAQKLPQIWLRRIILSIAILLTAAYFWTVYFQPSHGRPAHAVSQSVIRPVMGGTPVRQGSSSPHLLSPKLYSTSSLSTVVMTGDKEKEHGTQPNQQRKQL